MCLSSKIPFATVCFAIFLYTGFLTKVSKGNTNTFYESHIILSSYLKLALEYSTSVDITLDNINESKSFLSSLSLIGLQIPDLTNGQGILLDKLSSKKELKKTAQQNSFQNFMELFHFFSLHPAFSGNSGDLDVISACYSHVGSCPFGACSTCSSAQPFNKSLFHDHARRMVAAKFLTFDMGSEALLKRFAFGLVLLNTGHANRSIEHFKRLLKEFPNQPEALMALAVASFRLDSKANGRPAVSLMTDAMRMRSKSAELCARRAQLNLLLGNWQQAHADLTSGLAASSGAWQLLLQRCVVNSALGSNEAAFQDAKAALRLRRGDPYLLLLLGHVYTRLGRVRNAVETYKEVLADHPALIDARLKLADCYRVLRLTDRAERLLAPLLPNSSAEGAPVSADNRYAASKLLSMAEFASGNSRAALRHADNCLSLHPSCPVCLFRRAAALANLGQFYDSIRASTGIMVQADSGAVVSTPEFLRSHYLREWARLLHRRLDTPFAELNFTRDLQQDFVVRWLLGQSLAESETYKEESGLQPNAAEVTIPPLSAYTFRQQEVLCLAKRISDAFRTDADGAANNQRVLFALGLATVHMAQLLAGNSSGGGNQQPTWLQLVELSAKYVQLADLSRPVQSVNSLPQQLLEAKKLTFVHQIVHRGQPNAGLQSYFGLVFQLAKTMTEHSRGPQDGAEAKREFETAQTLDKVLAVAKRRRTYREEDAGLVVGTQVPSTKFRDKMRHEGAYIYLTEDASGACSLGVRLRLRTLRLRSYRDELDYLLGQLLTELRHGHFDGGGGKVNEQLVTRTLTLLYYLTNAMPLSHKSGQVSFSVALAVLLSAGVTAGGRLPGGKSLELEPVLAGTPDAFALVTRQWLKPAPATKSVTEYQSVGELASSVRSVLELLEAGASAKCPAA